MRQSSIHNKMFLYLNFLTIPLCREFYSDQYFWQEQTTLFDRYNSGTTALIKLGYNLVAPVLMAYAAAAIHQRLAASKTPHHSAPQRKSSLDDANALHELLLEDTPATAHATAAAPAVLKSAATTQQQQLDSFRRTRALMTLGFSTLVSLIPSMIQTFSKDPYHKTVIETEKVTSLIPVMTVPIVGMMHGVTDLLYAKQQNIPITSTAFLAACLISAKLGPFLIAKTVGIENMQGLETVGKTLGGIGMMLFTGLLPAVFASTKLTAVAKAVNSSDFIQNNTGMVNAVLGANLAADWLFGNLGILLQMSNHLYAAREESRFGLLTVSQLAVMAVATLGGLALHKLYRATCAPKANSPALPVTRQDVDDDTDHAASLRTVAVN